MESKEPICPPRQIPRGLEVCICSVNITLYNSNVGFPDVTICDAGKPAFSVTPTQVTFRPPVPFHFLWAAAVENLHRQVNDAYYQDPGGYRGLALLSSYM